MMRALVLVLLLANLGVYAWTKGWLDPVTGVRAQGDREPERLMRQVTPDAVRVLPPEAAQTAQTTPLPTGQADRNGRIACLEAGPFTPAQAPAAEEVLQGTVPAGAWTAVRADTPPVWTVYLGRFPNREALARKVEELERLKMPFREVVTPAELAPGLSLGRFKDRASAEEAMVTLAQRGVRTARVTELVPASAAVTLRVERADAPLQTRLATLRDGALLGKGFAACASTAAGAPTVAPAASAASATGAASAVVVAQSR